MTTPTGDPRRPPARIRWVVATAVLGLVVAIGVWLLVRDGDTGGSGAWSRSTDPVTTTGRVQVTGSVVTLGDGTTIDTGRAFEWYVVAGDGVYFLPARSAGERGPRELFLATTEQVVATGAHPRPDTLHASADGRYLGFLDEERRPWTTVVVDLEQGREVVRTGAGMGEEQRVEEQYEEFEPDLLGISDRAAWVLTVDAVVRYDLPSGDSEVVVADRADHFWDEPWFEELSDPAVSRKATYVEQGPVT